MVDFVEINGTGKDVGEEEDNTNDCEQPGGVSELTENNVAAGSANMDTPKSRVRQRVRAVDVVTTTTRSTISAKEVIMYQWPLGDRGAHFYMIQEQVSLYLGIKSFKRRYPTMERRAIDVDERGYLIRLGKLSNTDVNMGLTVIRSDDVLSLMAQDFPTEHAEYQMVIAERQKELVTKQHEQQLAVKHDQNHINRLRNKSMKNAFDWNSELNRERQAERRAFWDAQTMSLQKPKRQCVVSTDYGAYPVALLSGQYQNFYKQYDSNALYDVPITSVKKTSEVINPRPSIKSIVDHFVREPPPAIRGAAQALGGHSVIPQSNEASRDADSVGTSASADIAADGKRGDDTGEHCAFCEEDIYSNDRYVQCASCESCGHPVCLEFADETFTVVKTYNWECMECKSCSVCTRIDQEDKMLFCDRCDRGYHTFCVGLSAPPSGRWLCPLHCGGSGKVVARNGIR